MQSKLPCEYLDISNAIPAKRKPQGNRFIWQSTESGLFCLSTARHVELYSTLVWKNGGYLSLYDGGGRLIAGWPTLFTGSFVIEGGCEGGLYARVGAGNGLCPQNTVTWLESNE